MLGGGYVGGAGGICGKGPRGGVDGGTGGGSLGGGKEGEGAKGGIDGGGSSGGGGEGATCATVATEADVTASTVTPKAELRTVVFPERVLTAAAASNGSDTETVTRMVTLPVAT